MSEGSLLMPLIEFGQGAGSLCSPAGFLPFGSVHQKCTERSSSSWASIGIIAMKPCKPNMLVAQVTARVLAIQLAGLLFSSPVCRCARSADVQID